MPSRVGLWCWAVGLALCPVVQGQDRFEPSVTNPGARSLGLGGAFVALADDATAAYANPAGLVQLVRPEISVEVRFRGDQQGAAPTLLSGVGFGSFVLPRGRWSLAVYAQTLADLELSMGLGDTVVVVNDLTLANAGLSAGLQVSEALSVGLGLTFMNGSYSGLGFGSAQVPQPMVIDSTRSEAGFIAGVLWSLDEAWAFGLSHRSGADFEFGVRSAADQRITAVLPRVTAGGARWRSPDGQATVAVEIERLSGSDDRTRLHLGGEWAFLGSSPVVGLRVGLWHDPGTGSPSVPGPAPFDDVLHASGGVGVAFRWVQLDLGVDVSDVVTTTSLSAIFSW